VTEIVLVRHGETDSNIRGTYLGWTDVPLNETGLSQAGIAREKLLNEDFDICISSPLKRALDTARIIVKGKELDILTDERLKERNFGVWDDLTYDEIVNSFPEEHKKWLEDLNNYEVKDGESFSGSYNRIVGFVDYLVMKHRGKKILVVTHSGCIRKFLAYLTGMGIDGVWHFKVDNAKINRIEINDEGYAYISSLNA